MIDDNFNTALHTEYGQDANCSVSFRDPQDISCIGIWNATEIWANSLDDYPGLHRGPAATPETKHLCLNNVKLILMDKNYKEIELFAPVLAHLSVTSQSPIRDRILQENDYYYIV